METNHSDFEEKIGYRFKNPAFLQEALSHSSFVNELDDCEINDNERLEFLGDAVLNLVISHVLMDKFPDIDEGSLSRLRANLVNENQLFCIARKLDLGSRLLLGRGEILTGGSEKTSILADALEALIAAVYLDGGFADAFEFVEKLFAEPVREMIIPAADLDYKSRIQEVAQGTMKATPSYSIVSATGPDHSKTFTVKIRINDFSTTGTGKSKKKAEQEAARNALEILDVENTPDPEAP